ncbi:hypothetical protein DFQ00_111188 [Paenibacillus barcinonensis]|uniref:Uncharacterized protein n=1 Tax=Paenibacillus barcinonensis TaxID=198119 RepID=A0A2V4V617_PAEBA|nr:hypothetical protein DFQ00_111188 [Paenibacillus barcinonensis]
MIIFKPTQLTLKDLHVKRDLMLIMKAIEGASFSSGLK